MVHFYIANLFINKAMEEKKQLSPMKLQKLIYITYANYLKKNSIPLFPDRFAAWKYGPVLEEIYYEFKDFGANSIDRYYIDKDNKARMISDNGEIGLIINDVWNKFKDYSGIQLSMYTHQDDTAWSKAINNNNYYLSDGDIEEDGYKWQ